MGIEILALFFGVGCIFMFVIISLILLARALSSGRKCEHWNYCSWYQKDSPPCNEDGGFYTSESQAGCCRGWNDKINKRKLGIKWEKDE